MVSIFFVCLGAAGILAMTWLFPILAAILIGFQRRGGGKADAAPAGSSGAPDIRIAILVPAYNEETKIGRTLEGIQASMERARAAFPDVRLSLHVGSDGSSDGTAEIALRHGASVIRGSQRRGKWRMISMLVSVGRATDWVVLADAGIQWPVSLLEKVIPLCRDETLMAIAPTYRAPDAGWLESLAWSVETHFKRIESAMGGPVSVHGATVLYRTAELRQALVSLGSGNWLNDDVVVPLTLRALFPGKKIRYVSEVGVYDVLRSRSGALPARDTRDTRDTREKTSASPGSARAIWASQARREFNRRRRMVFGNIQWIRRILPEIWRRNAVVGLLALRRVCRMLWAWWGLSIALGIGWLVLRLYADRMTSVSPAAAAACAALATGALGALVAARPILDSAAASLLSPYYLLASEDAERISWT